MPAPPQIASSAATQSVFFGYSTQAPADPRNTTLTDVALINADLTNAFMTRVGERVMRPEYGCRLWDYMMEPLTALLTDQITAEAKRIIESDSRCTMQSFQATEVDGGFSIAATILYQPWNVILTFASDFVAQQTTALAGATS